MAAQSSPVEPGRRGHEAPLDPDQREHEEQEHPGGGRPEGPVQQAQRLLVNEHRDDVARGPAHQPRRGEGAHGEHEDQHRPRDQPRPRERQDDVAEGGDRSGAEALRGLFQRDGRRPGARAAATAP